VFELDEDGSSKNIIRKSQLEFVVPITVVEIFLENWKKQVFIDKKNQNVYIPDYSQKLTDDKEPRFYNIIHFDNSSKDFFDPIEVDHEIICEIIGKHQYVSTYKKIEFQDSLLYQDFLVHNNLLYIAHGKCVTIIDINLVKPITFESDER